MESLRLCLKENDSNSWWYVSILKISERIFIETG